MESITYKEAVKNFSDYIKSEENKKAVWDGEGINVFKASTILAVLFNKTKEETLFDILDLQHKFH